MGFFNRLFSRPEPGPAWAGKMSAADYALFLDLVDSECGRGGKPYRLDRDEGVVYIDHRGDGELNPCGLQNVAQLCGGHPKPRWPEIVQDHFSRLSTIAADAENLDNMSGDLDAVRHLLKVRLYPPDYPTDICVYDRPAEDFLACLVFDMPDSVVSVSPDAAGGWPVSKEELFRIALANVRGEPGINRSVHDVGDGCQIHSLTGDSFFVASQALLLEEHLPKPLPEMGALVAVPHRHMVVFHPIVDASVVTALNRMIPMAKGIYEEGPGSVSPSVYWWREAAWWHDGQFTRIPVTFSGRNVNVDIPPEFATKVLDRIT